MECFIWLLTISKVPIVFSPLELKVRQTDAPSACCFNKTVTWRSTAMVVIWIPVKGFSELWMGVGGGVPGGECVFFEKMEIQESVKFNINLSHF